jgi:uncharacterized NAD(P)/FAD-binding protein YdhS
LSIAACLRRLRATGAVDVGEASVVALEPAGGQAIAATLRGPRGEQRLLVDGLVDATGLVFEVRRSGHLYTLGALRRGELWETTAVPELRAQAARIAAALTRRTDAALVSA